jgi:hypothetical protein
VAEDAPVELSLFGLINTSQSTGGSSTSQGATGLVNELERIREELDERAQIEQWMAGSAAFGGLSLTVGYALWLLRGGALLASLLSTLPAWRLIDPLPVLARVDDDEEGDSEEGDDHAFASFIAEAPADEGERGA